MDKNSFNLDLNPNMFNNPISIFIKLIIAIIVVYAIVMILNFLRDKFLNPETTHKESSILSLLMILNKLFFISGIGFIIANIFQVLLSEVSGHKNNIHGLHFGSEWDYLTFGIIIMFVGLGLKFAVKHLKSIEV